MEQLKKDVEILLRRLVGKWAFLLDPYQFPDPNLIVCSYFMKGIEESTEDLVVFGHDTEDQSRFTTVLSPVTIKRRDFLFFMSGVNQKNDEYLYTQYRFNQDQRHMSGIFYTWKVQNPLLLGFEPETDPLVRQGSFRGFRQRNSDPAAQILLDKMMSPKS